MYTQNIWLYMVIFFSSIVNISIRLRFAEVLSMDLFKIAHVPFGTYLWSTPRFNPWSSFICTNYINSFSNKLFTLIFTDDTSAFIEGDNLPEMTKIFNDELNKLYDLCMDRLTINIVKTHYMLSIEQELKII